MVEAKDKSAHATLEKYDIMVVPFHMAKEFEVAQINDGVSPDREVRALIIDLPYEDAPRPG